MGFFPMQGHRPAENFFHPARAQPAPEVQQVARGNRKPPLEPIHARKILVVRILDPYPGQALIAMPIHLFEQQQTHHQPDRVGRAAGLGIQLGELALQEAPGQAISQLY
ncbi:hypothetical protein NC796_02150 [Aliifodinibius sp. S!AR15-10]|nr:hypothetical protein [Aliifodinibius sp. S!AR15-10]MDR8389922.1 hypothetical protein [Aliifodinibius sp. S!AR15-10]